MQNCLVAEMSRWHAQLHAFAKQLKGVARHT